MELDKLYGLAEKEDISVNEYDIGKCNGALINCDSENSIILNKKKINTRAEEKTVLAEELGHYYKNATYPASCNDKIVVSKNEFRAKKWSWPIIAPPNKIKKIVESGKTEMWEIAEELCVTEEMLQKALQYYRNNKLI